MAGRADVRTTGAELLYIVVRHNCEGTLWRGVETGGCGRDGRDGCGCDQYQRQLSFEVFYCLAWIFDVPTMRVFLALPPIAPEMSCSL